MCNTITPVNSFFLFRKKYFVANIFVNWCIWISSALFKPLGMRYRKISALFISWQTCSIFCTVLCKNISSGWSSVIIWTVVRVFAFTTLRMKLHGHRREFQRIAPCCNAVKMCNSMFIFPVTLRHSAVVFAVRSPSGWVPATRLESGTTCSVMDNSLRHDVWPESQPV